jgi:hypothetical protein
MPELDPEVSRAEIVLGAVLYLMTADHRTPCPRLAACVAAHLECLARHPNVDSTIRDVCAGMCGVWCDRADAAARYQWVAETLADAANAGLTRIGFVSDPHAREP